MAATLKHYVEFHFPSIVPEFGIFFEPTKVLEIKSRSIKEIKVPEKAYGFVLFDIQEAEENGITMRSDPLNVTPMHFYGGKIVTLSEIGHGKKKITKSVLCRDGVHRTYHAGDVIVMLPKKTAKEK